jgi:CRP/FNR family transcriptional regulator, cyclic AMP receptor protein
VAKPKLDLVLAEVPIFHGLTKRQQKRLADNSDVAEFMGGHSIVREGDPGDSFYVVLTGHAKVTMNGRFLRRLIPGDYFGEIALIDGGPRTATVASETPVTLLILRRPAFMRAVREDPGMATRLLAELARMLRRATKTLPE